MGIRPVSSFASALLSAEKAAVQTTRTEHGRAGTTLDASIRAETVSLTIDIVENVSVGGVRSLGSTLPGINLK